MSLPIVGVDEVGRGPLAGPVIAAAIILPDHLDMGALTLKDSKQLTETQRNKLALLLKEQAVAIGIGRAEVEEIDQLNIHHATLLAMKRAVTALKITSAEIRVDGKYAPDWNYPTQTIINGDALDINISAASIVAKVHRDNEMMEWHTTYPHYGFDRHKGYPTRQHLAALQDHGITPIHRKSFAPIKNLQKVINI